MYSLLFVYPWMKYKVTLNGLPPSKRPFWYIFFGFPFEWVVFFYVETLLDHGLHRVPLYTHCHTKTDSLHPPQTPSLSADIHGGNCDNFGGLQRFSMVLLWFLYGSSMIPLYDSSMIPLWFFYDSSMVPLWFLIIHLKFLSFSQGAKGNSCLYC